MSAIGDAQLIKLINQGVVYRMLRAKPGLSRAQLSQFTGLTKSTISLLVKELIEERWLVESDIFTKNSMGRPSTSIFVDSRSRTLIGVEFSKSHIQLVAVSTAGDIRFAHQVDHCVTEVDSVVSLIVNTVAQVNDKIQASGYLVGGIGIAYAGVFDEGKATLRSAMDFNWKGEPIVQKLRTAFKRLGMSDIPLFVHSDNHCCAVGAYEFSEQRADTLMYLDFSQTIQMGLVVGDRICAGVSGSAGAIGHTFIQGDGPLCAKCGRSGCVDAWLGSDGLAKLTDVNSRVSVVAALMHNLWKAFNPSIFVVGGSSLARWPGLFHEAKKRFLSEHDKEADVPTIHFCKHGELAAAVGAAALPHYYRLRPLDGPSSAICRALYFTDQRVQRETAHGHVSWH